METKGWFRKFLLFYISLFTLCSPEEFLKKVAENRPTLNLDFIGGRFSASFSKIPSEMHYMKNKIVKDRNLRNHPLCDILYNNPYTVFMYFFLLGLNNHFVL